MKIVTIKIEGVSPILMHNPEAMRSQGDGVQRGGKKIPLPYDEAKASLYVLPTGQLYIKSDAFREAGLIACNDIRDPTRKGRASMVRRFSASVFLSREHYGVVRPEDGTPVTSDDEDWVIDTRRVVVQKNGILRSRAKISPWGCNVEFEYDEETISAPLIAEIMTFAGKFPGVLDYRVGKKGPFGRFTAELIDNEGATHDKKRSTRKAGK